MTWYESEFGCKEGRGFAAARGAFSVHRGDDGDVTLTAVGGNNKTYHVGAFEDPSVEELRSRVRELQAASPADAGGLTFANIAGDARSLILDPENAGAVFQVASQFNCLEMVGPGTTPESGITQYVHDKTQGPVCAMACPAATVFRNYFWAERGQAGGSERQLDTARGLGEVVGNAKKNYWRMQNGYMIPARDGAMAELGARLAAEDGLAAAAHAAVRVGVHWSTQTATTKTWKRRAEADGGGWAEGDERAPHRVAQVFCSAVPVAYTRSTSASAWAPVAKLVLDAAFEATLLAAAVLALQQQRRVPVYLSCVGGGAFGNATLWIVAAIEKACQACAALPIDVRLVHYMHKGDKEFLELERRLKKRAAE